MASLYGAGAAIGFSPEQVKDMSIWEFNAALVGYANAHSSADKNKLSEEEATDLFDWIEAGNDNAVVRSTIIYDWDGERLLPAGLVTFEVN